MKVVCLLLIFGLLTKEAFFCRPGIPLRFAQYGQYGAGYGGYGGCVPFPRRPPTTGCAGYSCPPANSGGGGGSSFRSTKQDAISHCFADKAVIDDILKGMEQCDGVADGLLYEMLENKPKTEEEMCKRKLDQAKGYCGNPLWAELKCLATHVGLYDTYSKTINFDVMKLFFGRTTLGFQKAVAGGAEFYSHCSDVIKPITYADLEAIDVKNNGPNPCKFSVDDKKKIEDECKSMIYFNCVNGTFYDACEKA